MIPVIRIDFCLVWKRRIRGFPHENEREEFYTGGPLVVVEMHNLKGWSRKAWVRSYLLRGRESRKQCVQD